MTHSFSPFLAHLLMAGLARRALLKTDAPAEPPLAEDSPQAPLRDAVEATQPPALPSSGSVALQ